MEKLNKIISKLEKDKKYINRELSWIKFNQRVLYWANNAPYLKERFNFLSITNTNMDEFLSVRFPEFTDNKNLVKKIKEFMNYQMIAYNKLKLDLKKEYNFNITRFNNLSKKEQGKFKRIFTNEILPCLTPIIISSTDDIPIFQNGQNVIPIIINDNNEDALVLIPIPKHLKRFYKINDKICFIEDMITNNLDSLFINKKIIDKGLFRVIKDNSIILNHNNDEFILDRMIDTIEKRDLSDPVFISITKNTSKRLKEMITNVLDINSNNVFKGSNILDYTKLSDIVDDGYDKFKPFEYNSKSKKSIFTELKERDILLHHPYDSFNTVIEFIRSASLDKQVLAIKQTLYRVSSEESPIVNALCKAAERGKFVTVLIEIKARFDEVQNITLVDKMRRSGVNVVLGNEYIKTHCKMCLVVREEKDSVKIYSHIGTGNYNDKTAKQYTDISYLTSKQKINMDLIHIFNILSGISNPDEKLQKVFYAPVNLRKKLLKNINREIENVKKKKKAEIFIKVNSINDPEVISELYKAANAGVSIYIICRGVCSIVPQKNIYIKSIVGRFLEHSRIYYFRNDNNPEYYISSADLLVRNLDKRVETLLLINDSKSIKKLKSIINILKKDEYNSFKMLPNGNYEKIKGKNDCHSNFIKGDK